MKLLKSPCRECASTKNRMVCSKDCELLARYRNIQNFEDHQKTHPLRKDYMSYDGCRQVLTTPKFVLDACWPEN